MKPSIGLGVGCKQQLTGSLFGITVRGGRGEGEGREREGRGGEGGERGGRGEGEERERRERGREGGPSVHAYSLIIAV